MAVVTYTQQAALSQFQQWLMQQGALACQERQSRAQTLAPACTGGATAQLGDSIRYTVRTSIASQVVTFSGRYVRPDGTPDMVMEQVTATSAGSPTRLIRPAAPGCYTNMVASFGNDTVTGTQVHVLAELGRTVNGIFVPFAVLLDGYSTTQDPLDMGNPIPNQTAQGGGSTGGGGGCCLGTLTDDVFTFTSQVYTVTVPAGANGRLVYLAGNVVTDSNAANRTLNLQLNPASGFGWFDTNANVQTASQTKGYIWELDASVETVAGTGEFKRSLPSNLWFSGDFTVELRLNNVQAGDTIASWDLTYEIKGP